MVQLAARTRDGSFSCVKRFAKEEGSSNEAVRKEFELMQKVGPHPRLAEALDLFQDDSFYYLELPYNSGGDFSGLARRATNAGVHLGEAWWVKVFKQCLQALIHVHLADMVHCDVKEPNLMLSTDNYEDPQVVLIDFGVARSADEEEQQVIYGTPGYIPPEVWDTKKWQCAGDLFSFGVVLVQVLSGRVPDLHQPRAGIFLEGTRCFKDVATATRARSPPLCTFLSKYPGLLAVADKLLEKDPRNRPSALEALIQLSLLGHSSEAADGSGPAGPLSPFQKGTLSSDALSSDACPEDSKCGHQWRSLTPLPSLPTTLGSGELSQLSSPELSQLSSPALSRENTGGCEH